MAEFEKVPNKSVRVKAVSFNVVGFGCHVLVHASPSWRYGDGINFMIFSVQTGGGVWLYSFIVKAPYLKSQV